MWTATEEREMFARSAISFWLMEGSSRIHSRIWRSRSVTILPPFRLCPGPAGLSWSLVRVCRLVCVLGWVTGHCGWPDARLSRPGSGLRA